MSAALDAFMETAQRIVYCTLATVDRRGRPRSRIVHAVWERPDEDELVGWVGSRPTPMRRAHIRANPFVSCLYWDAAHDVAAAECKATWIEDDAGRRDAWERLSAAPAPMGYDPAPIWPDGPEADGFVALRLDPWRVQAKSATAMAAGEPYLVWTP
jgi:pyridoxamine 5'-phosphate oxidase-like protein